MASKNIMISHFWKNVSFVCANHPDVGMKLEPQGQHIVYRCEVCGCSTPYFDAEKFINKAQQILVDDADNDSETNLTNFKMAVGSRIDSKKHTFTVLSHKQNKMKVSIKNG